MKAIKPDPPVNPAWKDQVIGTGGDPRFYALPVLHNPNEDLQRYLSMWKLDDNERLMMLAALQDGRDITICVELNGNAFRPNMYPGMRVTVGQPSSAYTSHGDHLGFSIGVPPARDASSQSGQVTKA